MSASEGATTRRSPYAIFLPFNIEDTVSRSFKLPPVVPPINTDFTSVTGSSSNAANSLYPPGKAVSSFVCAASNTTSVFSSASFSTVTAVAPAFSRTPQRTIFSDSSISSKVSPVRLKSFPAKFSAPSSFTKLKARSFAESPSSSFPVNFTVSFKAPFSGSSNSSSPVSNTCFNCVGSAQVT